MRYFFCENAHRPFKVGGKTYSPEVVSNHGGTAQGVLAIESEAEVASLLASVGKMLEEITVEAYEELRAKKKRTAPSQRSASQAPRVFGGASAIKGAPGGVVMPGVASLTLGTELPVSAADVVRVERISAEAPPTSGESVTAPARGQRRAKKTTATLETVADPKAAEPSLSADEPAL